MDFLDISTEEQAERLAALARKALGAWELGDARVELIKYRENAVFSVTAQTGERFAMRVHRPGYRSDRQIRSEFDWMRALSDAGVRTPEVVATLDGEPLSVAAIDSVPEPRQCDLLRWIEGAPIGTIEDGVEDDERAVTGGYRMLGKIAATVHEHGAAWERPEGFSRPAWNVASLVGDEPTFGRFWELDCLSKAQLRTLLAARDEARERLQAFGQGRDRYGLIHGDFLPENLYVGDGTPRLLDFDDCGESWYVFELATSVFFLQGQPNYEPICNAYIEGYRSVRPLGDEELTMLPTMLIARGLSYLGWPVGRPEIDSAREWAPYLADTIEGYARAYLEHR